MSTYPNPRNAESPFSKMGSWKNSIQNALARTIGSATSIAAELSTWNQAYKRPSWTSGWGAMAFSTSAMWKHSIFVKRATTQRKSPLATCPMSMMAAMKRKARRDALNAAVDRVSNHLSKRSSNVVTKYSFRSSKKVSAAKAQPFPRISVSLVAI